MNINKHYLVVGLGVTGFSVVEYLTSHGFTVTVTDSRVEPPKLADLKKYFPQVPVFAEQITVPDYITDIILSPGVAISEPALAAALQRNVPIIGDIELFARVVDKPVLAVTGSNGKSTVTTLLGLMAQASNISAGVGGNLGTAALSLLDPQHQCYILELSSFQLETLQTLRPLAATILNISPDHMDRYVGLEDYAAAKQRIYNNAQHAIFNRADHFTFPDPELNLKTVSFGLDQASNGNYGVMQHSGQAWLAKGDTPLMAVKDLAMLGEHNVANALAALAMGEIAGFNMQAMLTTLRTFPGLEHRCEKILAVDQVLWVNDSKGTNVAATVAALEGLAKSIAGKWIIILGGVGKNADFSPLIAPLQKYCQAAVLIGEEAEPLWNLLHTTTKCYKANNLSEVVSIAQQHTHAGDGVLLSPACASFDMFNNYMHRGELFKLEVRQRIGKHHATTSTT